MFTSRAEFRLSLREDNADLRLSEEGKILGLVDESRWRHFCERRRRLDKEEARLKTLRMKTLSIPAKAGQSVAEWLRMPESSYARLGVAAPLVEMSDIAEIEARHKYAGYIANQKKKCCDKNKRKQCKYRKILTLTPVGGLSAEVRDLLRRHHPSSIRQANRISGITPAALAIVAAHIKTHELSR